MILLAFHNAGLKHFASQSGMLSAILLIRTDCAGSQFAQFDRMAWQQREAVSMQVYQRENNVSGWKPVPTISDSSLAWGSRQWAQRICPRTSHQCIHRSIPLLEMKRCFCIKRYQTEIQSDLKECKCSSAIRNDECQSSFPYSAFMRFSCTGVLPCSCGASSLLPLWEGMRSVGLTAGHCRVLNYSVSCICM